MSHDNACRPRAGGARYLLAVLLLLFALSGCGDGGGDQRATSPADSDKIPAAPPVDDDKAPAAPPENEVPAPPSAALSGAEVVQAAGAVLSFRIELDGPGQGAAQVSYTTADRSARAGTDYAETRGTLEFRPGQRSATVEVPLLNRRVLDEDEALTLELRLSDAKGVKLPEPAKAVGTIRANEALREMVWVGAAARRITPSQDHIDGVIEPRALEQERVQRFHLGGFGLGPLEAFPQPLNDLIANDPAGARLHAGPYGEEHTWLRAQVLRQLQEDGEWLQVALISIDAVGAGNVIQDGLRAKVHEATGIHPDNILFGQTHSHAGADLQGLWGGVPQSWIDNDDPEAPGLYQLAAEAVLQAQADSVPARLTVADTRFPEGNNYRRARILGSEEADDLLTVLQAANTLTGEVVATLVQYSAHPTNVGAGMQPRAPHPDFVVGLTDLLEEVYGGVALYYNGPIAEASSAGPGGDDAYLRSRARGEQIALRSIEALEVNGQELPQRLAVRHRTAVLPVTNPVFIAAAGAKGFDRYYQFSVVPLADVPLLGDVATSLPLLGDLVDGLPLLGGGSLLGDVPEYLGRIPLLGRLVREADQALPQVALTGRTLVSRLTLGDAEGLGLELVTLPGEATNTFGREVRGLTDSSHVMLLGLTQNSFGYILPEEEFAVGELLAGEDPYEETVSLGPLTAPMLRVQAYYPLFDAEPPHYAPGYLAACGDPARVASQDCLLGRAGIYLQNSAPAQLLIEGADRFQALFAGEE